MTVIADLHILAEVLEKEKKLEGLTNTAVIATKILENSSYFPIITKLLSSIEKIDDEKVTFIHSLEVGLLCIHFQKAMEEHLSTSFNSELLLIGGLIHDVGKTKIPILILNKPGRLTEKEFNIMKTHTRIGKEIALSAGVEQKDILDMIEYHHETPEGTGYYGLKLDELNPYAITCNIADQFSAISQKRPYKAARTKEETLKIMLENNIDKRIIDKIS